MSKQRKALELAQAFIRWTQFGECRTEHHEDPIPTAAQVDAAICEALAEQEQEPVAWMMVNEEHGHKPTLHWKPQEDWHITWKAVPLYTAPQVLNPLTDYLLEALEQLVSIVNIHQK